MLSALALSAALALGSAGCDPVPGAEILWANPATRFVVIGEMHGTVETPAVFADLICSARVIGRPIAVALEHPTSSQGAIDDWLASDGGPGARAALLKSGPWNFPVQDGRGSTAMLSLLDKLRLARQQGHIVGVSTFVPETAFPTPEGREQSMAEAIVAKASPSALTFVLVGNAHARRVPISRPGAPSYQPMAVFLPPGTMTINVRPSGGSAWGCFGEVAEPPAQTKFVCESRALPRLSADEAFGVELTTGVDQPYSAVLHLGRPATASTPAASHS